MKASSSYDVPSTGLHTFNYKALNKILERYSFNVGPAERGATEQAFFRRLMDDVVGVDKYALVVSSY